MLNKKADIGLGAIIVILIIIIFLGWLINEGWKECRIDSDCKEGQYCSSKFECNDIPVIEKTLNSPSASYNYAAWIVGLSLVAAALIMKWDTIFGKKKKEKKKEEDEDLTKEQPRAEDKGLYEDFLDEKGM